MRFLLAAVILSFTLALPSPALMGDEKEEGFVPLFNGKDFEGWIENPGYVAIDGKIVCDPKKGNGGNLFTEKEYPNFVLRFEFKLPPGGNNGVGFRAPMKGTTSRTGFELQILDNTAKKYQKLKPYQYHGSLYGLVPAKRGYLKPLGEWNTQEVTVDGDLVKVVLNGERDHDREPGRTPQQTDDGRTRSPRAKTVDGARWILRAWRSGRVPQRVDQGVAGEEVGRGYVDAACTVPTSHAAGSVCPGRRRIGSVAERHSAADIFTLLGRVC